MEIIEVAKKIEERIGLLAASRGELKRRSARKSKAIADYDRALALTIVRLKNNLITEAFGVNVENLPATLIEKTAKGIIYNEKLEMEIADAEYKDLMAGIEAVKAELNGYQSINRHLSEV